MVPGLSPEGPPVAFVLARLKTNAVAAAVVAQIESQAGRFGVDGQDEVVVSVLGAAVVGARDSQGEVELEELTQGSADKHSRGG